MSHETGGNEESWEDWAYEDTGDGCCGTACTPNGCHESHPTGMFDVQGIEWAYDHAGLMDEESARTVVGCVNALKGDPETLRALVEVAKKVWRIPQEEDWSVSDLLDAIEDMGAAFEEES